MQRKDPFKIGITIGEKRGERMFETNVEHPQLSLSNANRFIHDKFDPGFSLFFVDSSNNRRRSRRRG